ncbi:MAG: adenylate/guanylate cyclase domain-containing protein [Xanthobacteraceae bacterium]
MTAARGTRLIYLAFVSALIGGAILLRHEDPFFVRALRLIAFDHFERLDPPEYDPKLPIRIVDIDEASLAKIGQWPWPRTTVRDLLAELASKGAAVIAFDVLFAEPDRTSLEAIVKQLPASEAAAVTAAMAGRPSNDQQFADEIRKTPSVLSIVLGQGPATTLAAKAGFASAGDDPRPFLQEFTSATPNLPQFEEAAHGIGAFNWVADRDQIVRRVSLMFRLNDSFVPSLAAEALRVAQGASTFLLKASNASGETAFGQSTGLNHIRIGDITVPTDDAGGVYLKFRHYNKAEYIPAWKVLAGDVAQDDIEGRIILVGTSAPGLLDLRATPVDAAVPGIDIHAQVLEHFLNGTFLERPDYAAALEEFVILALGIMLAVFLPRVSAKGSGVIGLLTIALVLLGGWAAFRYGNIFLDPSYPALVLGIMTACITMYTYNTAEVQRAQIRSAFGQYLAPALVEQLANSPEKLVLGGEQRNMSILFSDVRGFTAISESYKDDPQGLTSLMNRLLTPLTNTIVDHDGTVDKYIGDAVMAFWNAPLDVPHHEHSACAAALAMLDSLQVLNQERQEEAASAGQPFLPFRIGIGINTGQCVVGNLGSHLRFNYSVLGDPVNVASRLEGQTKYYGVPVILGSRTGAKAKEKFAILELDLIAVKGKTEPETIYALLGRDEVAGDVGFQELRKLYSTMLYCYRSRDWEGALEAVELCRSSENKFGLGALFDLYRTRIEGFQASAPPADWAGVFVAETK